MRFRWRTEKDDTDAQDAARLLGEMWSTQRVARLTKREKRDQDDVTGDGTGVNLPALPDPDGEDWRVAPRAAKDGGPSIALHNIREMLDEVEIVGYPKRHRELIQLRHLLERYPTEAREILAQFQRSRLLAKVNPERAEQVNLCLHVNMLAKE